MKGPAQSSRPGWEYLILATALLLMAAIMAMLFPYCWFQADDYCRAAGGAEQGVIASTTKEYMEWSGRWLGIGIEYCVLVQNEMTIYRLFLACIAIAYWLCLEFFIATLLPQLGRGSRYLATGVLFGLYWCGLPETRDTMYWLCGSVEYQLSIALAVLSFATAMRLALNDSGTAARVGLFALATITAFAVTGIHELFGLMISIVMISAALLAWMRKSKSRWLWSWIACVAVVGFLMAYFAPGHRVRIQNLENYGNPSLAIKGAVQVTLAMLPDWIFDARLLLATGLFVWLLQQERLTFPWLTADLSLQLRWIVPAVWLVLLAGCIAGPAWGTGGVVASRTFAATYMIFLLGWFTNCFLLVNSLKAKDIQLLKLHPFGVQMMVILLAASLLMTGNTRRAIRELAGPLQQYTQAKQQRHELLLQAGQEQQTVAVVPPLPNTTDLVGFGDVTKEHDNWINRCAARYYGVGEIRIEESE